MDREWANFYSIDDYVKDGTANENNRDETTTLMTSAVTKETCNANNGFVCKVNIWGH